MRVCLRCKELTKMEKLEFKRSRTIVTEHLDIYRCPVCNQHEMVKVEDKDDS